MESPARSFAERHNLNPVLFAFGSLAIIFVLYQLVAGTITYLLVGSVKVTRSNVTELRMYTMVGQLLFIFLPTLLLARLLTRDPVEVFPWRIPALPETVYALVGLLFLQQIFQIYLFFQEMIPLPHVLQELVDQFKEMIDAMFKGLVTAESVPELLVVFLVVALVPSIVEEMFFRGLIQGSFQKGMKPIQAAVLTGAIFGLYHFNPLAVVPLVGLGCYFGILRLRSRSMFVPVTAHLLNNGLAVLAVYFSMNDEIILGTGVAEQPNIRVVLLQFVAYGLLFYLAFKAYLRTTAHVKEIHESVQ